MIKSKLLRTAMMCALTASLVIAPVAGASAKTSADDNPVTESGGGSKSSSSTSAPSAASTSSVKVGGQEVKTTVAGQYYAKNVNGVAVVTPKAEMSAALGLKNGEQAFAKIYTSSYGPMAQASVKAAADIMGVPVGPVLDITVGKLAKDGKFTNVASSAAPVSFTVGVPANFAQAGNDYAVICVAPGGATVVLKDIDSDPNTVTFNTNVFGVFALVKAPAGSFATLQ